VGKGIGIGAIVVIGLIAWWLTRSKQAQAATGAPSGEVSGLSEYEKLHITVPITRYIEKELVVFDNLEH